MPVQGDLGVEVVDRVRQRREFRDDGISDRERGFVVRPLGVTQEVWADAPLDELGSRVHVRSHLVKGFEGTPVQLRALSSEMSRGPLSTVVRHPHAPAQLQLASSLHVNAANHEWAAELLAFLARQQLAAARYFAHAPALVEAGLVSERNSVAYGVSSGVNEPNLAVPDAFSDANPSDVADMTQILAVLQNVWQVHAVRTPRGVIAMVPCADPSWGDVSALIEIEAKSHIRLGLGLWVSLNVPGWAEVPDALAFAEAEFEPACRTDVLGCWFVTEGVLTHRSFMPVFVATKAEALHVVTAAARRALWLSLGRGVPSRDGRGADQPPVRRLLRFPFGLNPAPSDGDE